MQTILNWLDDRTSYRNLSRHALDEVVPGGARWRYVWGSTLVFVFTVQMITGIFLWMHYSPSAQTAWESVFFIQFELPLGWLVRGIHHYAAQAMVVLLALHFLQIIIDGAYRAPREFNYWLGMALALVVLGLALTGYLLPWDQKGYWATQVATKIAGNTPLVGEQVQEVVVGGNEYGHYTLTRFFAMHAGLLPAILVILLVLHLALFRKHGLTPKLPLRGPDAKFWPDQLAKDAFACFAVLAILVGLTLWHNAPLGAPANPAEPYDAARPEWYFLFLFQFLKFFHGENGIQIGAIYIPGAIFLLLLLMPFVGRAKWGHRLNVAIVAVLLMGTGYLTYLALREDRIAQWVDSTKYEDRNSYLLGEQAESAVEAISQSLESQGEGSPYYGQREIQQFAIYLENKPAELAAFQERLAQWQEHAKSEAHLEAVAEAERLASRSHELAADGIPPTGALTLLENDPLIQGPRLFAQHCASCHDHRNLEDSSNAFNVAADSPSAANLFGFGSRKWASGILDAEQLASPDYFGHTAFAEGEMVAWVQDTIQAEIESLDGEDLELFRQDVDAVVAALAAEADLTSGEEPSSTETEQIDAGQVAIVDFFGCIDCHKFGDDGDLGLAPDLTGYGSRNWLIEFISDPTAERFYRDTNDRMPVFHGDPENPSANLLSQREIELIVDWMRMAAAENASEATSAPPTEE